MRKTTVTGFYSAAFCFCQFLLLAVLPAVRWRAMNSGMLCEVILRFPDAMGVDRRRPIRLRAPWCRPGDPPGYWLRTLAVRRRTRQFICCRPTKLADV